ncbi:hypothetical protein [Pseudonocardia sp.]|uniref:hypothetical protein n=1 Tax=Pseudonocardia sp. TaxID=60912 RepID=UPI002637F4FB|nr:hypothetical protein [Pseudonocardia sp.]
MPVDQRVGDPVVGRALGEREREHQQPHEQRARLPPGGQHATPRTGLPRRGRGREEPHRDDHEGRDQHHDAEHLGGERHPEGGTERADTGAADRAEAERPVQARHERPAEAAFDVGTLDVHRDVPHAHPEPGDEQAGRRGRHRAGEQAGREPGETEGDGEGAGKHGPARPEARDERPGQRQPDHRTDGQAQQQQRELRRGQPERVADGRSTAHERREREAVGGEGHHHRGAGAQQRGHVGLRSNRFDATVRGPPVPAQPVPV